MLMDTDANIRDYERYWTGMLIPARAGDSWVLRQALRSIVPGSLRQYTHHDSRQSSRTGAQYMRSILVVIH
jgi:hypothetical protein